MEPRRTPALAPIALRVADDLRIDIETGRLAPGDSLPTLHEITQRWHCSLTSARSAVGLLKQQGLITGGRGKAPVVRAEPPKVERTSLRHQQRKRPRPPTRGHPTHTRPGRRRPPRSSRRVRLHRPLHRRTRWHRPRQTVRHRPGRAGAAPGVRTPGSHHRPAGRLVTVLDPPGTDQRQPADQRSRARSLARRHHARPEHRRHRNRQIIDGVTATMPTTVEASMWALPEGVPLLWVRRISLDTTGRTVEISDAHYPADRTKLTFHTSLTPWYK